MKDATPKAIYLADYQPLNYKVSTVDLYFALHDAYTEVRAELEITRTDSGALHLDGQKLDLQSVAINGQALTEQDYQVTDDHLILSSTPESFTLNTVVHIDPAANTALEGLYRSRTMYCTQCEAEGFRKITYYPDRPDVMAVFTTTVEAAQDSFPVLLSNGNPVAKGQADNGRHWAKWYDPFPKPCYLFALVAGQLSVVEDSFTTMSGRDVSLQLFVEEKDLDKCDHALLSLQNAMLWDEQTYGREYDLDLYMIVAVDDFNMGAMENKGLNIFNTSCVLANPAITTDAGFQRIEAIVAHEYFHNWSGNRVTCRDWFQLSLKEGFTVYRDSEFSADMGSRDVKRIEDVTFFRTSQFAEDAGPTAHPVRPASYIEINNFYTLTIYEKGAEVVRMIAELLGPEQFRAATDVYFERFDGQAVTCDDFVICMEEVSGLDLIQFKNWYSQAGTPAITASSEYDEDAGVFHLDLEQFCPATPGQAEKLPFHIPVKIALLGEAGALRLEPLEGEADFETSDNTEVVLQLTEAKQRFSFKNIHEQPLPSLLRGFSAPVKLSYDYSENDLRLLLQRDTDGFNRSEAANQLKEQQLKQLMANPKQDCSELLALFGELLASDEADLALKNLLLLLPSEAFLAGRCDVVDPLAISSARQSLAQQIGIAHYTAFEALYHSLSSDEAYAPEKDQMARRALRNRCLAYLAASGHQEAVAIANAQFQSATNMTDKMAALAALVHNSNGDEKQAALASFYDEWQHEALVVNQWFQVQASDPSEGGVERVNALLQHPAFDESNPNKVRAVVAVFSQLNEANFHRADGAGYKVLGDAVRRLNERNPQLAARLITPLTKWRRYTDQIGGKMKHELEQVLAEPSLSPDVYEIVSKSL